MEKTMFALRLSGKPYKISSSIEKKSVAPFILTIVMALMMVSDIAYAGNFWDKIKDAAKKNQQQQQQPQKQQQQQQRSSSQPQKTSNANLPKFNIRGMYLGMPMKDAQALLENLNPRMKVTPQNFDIGMIRGSRVSGSRFFGGLTAITDAGYRPSTTENFMLAGNTPQNAETVVGIGRVQHLGLDMALLSDMEASFIEKYGSPVFKLNHVTDKTNAYTMLSWSLDPKGKPQKNESVIIHCSGLIKLKRNQSRTKGIGVVSNAILFANNKAQGSTINSSYQQCGFTFVVKFDVVRVNYSKNPVIRTYITVLYDGNENRKSVNKTIAYTEKLANKIDAGKLEKLRGANKPQL